MDSKEKFMFEVPIVNLDIENHEVGTAKDNDCCIIEGEAAVENKSIYYANTATSHTRNHEEDKSSGVTKYIIIEPAASIIIDDSRQDNDCTIVENLKSSNNTHDLSFYDVIYKENKLLVELIEKCLDMENSQDMLKIVNNTLIPMYNDSTETFRKSAEFKKILLQKIMKLDTEPQRKFSHIKDLCQIIKLNKDLIVKKKRVSLITLETHLNGKYSKKSSKDLHRVKPAKRKKHCNMNLGKDTPINCDSDTDMEISIVDSHVQIIDSDSDSSVQCHNDDDVVAIDDITDNSNKENSVANVQANNTISSNEDINDHDKIVNPGELLKPQTHQTVEVIMNTQSQVEELERQIEEYQKQIEKLEEKEVRHDDFSSPYVLCEQYKAKVVSLYKELCEIMGAQAVKRHEVRLKVAKGHPEGPVKCLEDFINSNIDEHGNPPFPDMADVTECVRKANIDYHLNWNRHQILEEAHALFIHYGRAIQKRRQNREYRDLLKYVKVETQDPAEHDPQLLARLERNHLIGKRKEQELLQKYADMETPVSSHYGLSVSINNEEDSADSDYESTPPPLPNVTNGKSVTVANNKNNAEDIKMNSYAHGCSGNINNVSIHVASKSDSVNNIAEHSNNIINIEDDEPAPNQINKDLNNLEGSMCKNHKQILNNLKIKFSNLISKENDDRSSEENLDTRIVDENVDSRIVDENVDNRIVKENVNNIVEGNINNRIGEENLDTNNKENLQNRVLAVNTDIDTTKTDNVVVKREPEDICRMLEELGDNFTTTIIDILDPFMVIEVSDSSESEEEEIE